MDKDVKINVPMSVNQLLSIRGFFTALNNMIDFPPEAAKEIKGFIDTFDEVIDEISCDFI